MFAALMGVSAFVMAAAALVGVWLTISALADGKRNTDSVLTEHNSRMHELGRMITKNAPEQLRAELDDLRGALDVIRASNRKEFGSLWGRLGGKPSGDTIQTVRNASGDFEALLDLQSRGPVGPQ